jgi:Na+(H+)/acetate symporter ActP
MLAQIDPYILTFSFVTVAITVWMGFRSAKTSKTASDFFVAGRSVGVGMNASAISGEYLSAASFMGIAGMVMSSGYDALWYPVCYACGYLFLLLFIAGPLRRFGAYTIPDFAEGRFDSPVFRKIAVVFVLFIGFFYTMPQMKGAGTTLAYIFPGLPYWAGVVLVGAVITLNVALGGMKGITLVQAFQYWAKMFAISVPIFVLMAVYGHYGKQLEVNGEKTVSGKVGQWVSETNSHLLTNSLTHSRVPLPAKAPADATWLNPFGPLTTKAAKNAAKAIGEKAARDSAAGSSELNFLMVYERTNTPPAIWKRGVRNLLGHEWAAKFGIVVHDSVQLNARRHGTLPVAIVLHFYGTLSHKSVFCDERVVHGVIAFPTNRLEDKQFLRTARTVLESNFLIVVSESESEIHFATTNYDGFVNGQMVSSLEEFRRTGRVISTVTHGGLIGETMKRTPGLNPPKSNTIPLRTGLAADQRMTVPLDSLTVTQALGVYAELTGRQLLPNTNSLATRADDFLGGKLSALKLVQRPRTPDAGVREHGDGAFTAAEVKETIEVHLRTNGLVLAAVGGKGFIVSPSSEVAKNDHLMTENQSPAPNFQPRETKNQPQEGKNYPSEAKTQAPEGENQSPTPKNQSPMGDFQSQTPKNYPPEGSFQPLLAQNQAPAGNFQPPAPAIPPSELKPQSAAAVSVAQAAEKAWLAKHEKPLALLYTYSLIIAIVCGTAGLPHILVRFYTNPDGVAAKRTTMWVMILIGVFYVFPPVFGVIGRNLLPDLYNGLGAKGTDKIVLELPRLLNEKYAPLGSILSGITCAGAFAAFMSTFSGLLVSMTGALAHDVYGRILRPKSTPEQRMRMFKIGAVLIGGVAIVLGSFVEPLEINFMVGQAFAIAAASYFPLLFMAVWWRKLTMKGAAVGMLVGGVCALVAAALTNFSNLALDKGPMGKIFSGFAPLNDFWAAHPLLRILCEQPAIWAVPLAIILMIVVSKLTAKTVPSDSRMKMLVLHAPEQLGLKQEYIQEHQAGPGH